MLAKWDEDTMNRKPKLSDKISEQIYYRQDLNKKLLKYKKSWGEVNKLVNKSNTMSK
jgi:hypothetical protein